MKAKMLIAALALYPFALPTQAAVIDFAYTGIVTDGSDNVKGSPISVKFSWDTDSIANFISDYGYGDGKIYMANWWGPQSGFGSGAFSSPITITDTVGTHVYEGGSLVVYYHGGYLSPFQRTTYLVRSNPSNGDYAEISFGDMTETDFDGKMPSVLPASGNASFRVNGAEHYGNAPIALAVSAAVPEPATWAMMIGGFGMMGATLRRRRRAAAIA